MDPTTGIIPARTPTRDARAEVENRRDLVEELPSPALPFLDRRQSPRETDLYDANTSETSRYSLARCGDRRSNKLVRYKSTPAYSYSRPNRNWCFAQTEDTARSAWPIGADEGRVGRARRFERLPSLARVNDCR